ncbi:MAG: shikimate dehydrogenase [Anaerolineae bacterium]|nr:shikimate dehydrogenase [Anaerolineae bacterium]
MGWPVGHSVSPAMHNAAFAALGLSWRYEPLAVPPEDLAHAVERLAAEGWRGANVTVPHKEAVVGLLDDVDGPARTIGAVNTIVTRQGGLVGANTDAPGAMEALRQGGFEPAGRRALVLGAGGAARAVVYGLLSAGCGVTVHNRTPERAAMLARDLGGVGPPVVTASNLADLDLGAFDLLVNATSAGMAPHVAASPWPEALPLLAQWTVFDLVYNPAETRLLARARAAGARVVEGLPMLVQQGALAFRLWTGATAPVGVMDAAARHALELMSLKRP